MCMLAGTDETTTHETVAIAATEADQHQHGCVCKIEFLHSLINNGASYYPGILHLREFTATVGIVPIITLWSTLQNGSLSW